MGEPSREPAAAALTARGASTRSRIVVSAAELMRVGGVGATTLDDVVVASKVSKSQLYRHFDDKAALVRAVIEFVGDQTIDRERASLGRVTSLSGLRRWRNALVAHTAILEGKYGCPLGSLANEVADQDPVARAKLDELFAAWRQLFEELFHRFGDRGVIPAGADASRLATAFVAAVQGGYLLAQTSRDARPMADALDVAISHLELLSRTPPGR